MQQKIPLAETDFDFTTAPKRFRNKEARSSFYYVVEKKDGLKQHIMGTSKNLMGYVA